MRPSQKRLGVPMRTTGQAVSLARRESFDCTNPGGASKPAPGSSGTPATGPPRPTAPPARVPIRTLSRAHSQPFDEQRLMDLYIAGATLQECGRAFGRDFGRLVEWARNNLARVGVPLRTLSESTRLRRQRERAPRPSAWPTSYSFARAVASASPVTMTP